MQKLRIAAVAGVMGAVFASQSVLAVNKCKGPDGTIVYSDLPCAMSADALDQPDLTNARSRSRVASAALDMSPLPPIDFGKDQATQLNRASAMVASILVDARDCDWDLKVTRRADRCAKFLHQLIDGREWTQAISVLATLSGDENFSSRHRLDLSKVLRDAEEVVKIKEFAVVRANK